MIKHPELINKGRNKAMIINMRKIFLYLFILPTLAVFLFSSCGTEEASGPDRGSNTPDIETIIVDHTCTDINTIPRSAIVDAVDRLHIAYGHTSHGAQLTDGMAALPAFLGDTIYEFSWGGVNGSLDLRDKPFSQDYMDLSDDWDTETRAYLSSNPDINVVIWAWCGEVSYADSLYIEDYLSRMSSLEAEYPQIRFVYMTGHLDGTGTDGNLNVRNDQIREYCLANGKALYDFADIESYDPDGDYYLDRGANDACQYDSDGNGTLDANWAVEWRDANPGEWYYCNSNHSDPLNANLKAYAAWYLWARLGSWEDD